MKAFADLNLSMEELLQLNYCHLFLRAFHLCDIVDGSGLCITDDTWQGSANDMVRTTSWPIHGNPTRNDWNLLEKTIKKCFLSRGLCLKFPLGLWSTFDEKWPWYYAPSSNRFYFLSDTKYTLFPASIIETLILFSP
jgi:hypothetical protein